MERRLTDFVPVDEGRPQSKTSTSVIGYSPNFGLCKKIVKRCKPIQDGRQLDPVVPSWVCMEILYERCYF